MKVVDAIGAQLDWMVAKCAGYVEQGVYGTPEFRDGEVYLCYCDVVLNSCYSPTTNWAQGGPIIERERISIRPDVSTPNFRAFVIRPPEGMSHRYIGPTPLIAAMRAYVASKLGDEVDVPEELL